MVNANVTTIARTLVLLITAGCSFSVTKEEVVGTYELRYSYGTETLRLNADGTFEQSFLLKEEKMPKLVRGQWQLNPKDNTVALESTLVVDDNFGKLLRVCVEV